MTPPPRVRFAPSPTGFFHVGGARTALFNWLFARRHGGVFVLRIEDTDAERNREEWVDGIRRALQWLGADWDEQYRQSERLALYHDAAGKLLAAGHAYWCECTREQIDERTKANKTPGYDGFCRGRGLGPGEGRALRFRSPEGEGKVMVTDLIRGTPEFTHDTIEDFVIQRADGSPLFILANVVDDVDMRISHVVRGEEHLNNTAKYLLLWEALGGGEQPVFAHVPVLVNEKRQKLSKRRDKVALEDYREQGYLAEAMRNYLVLLGWAPGDDREFLTVEEMIESFALEAVNSAPAFFDEKKLLHFNGHYLRLLTKDEFIAEAGPFLAHGPWAPGDFDFDIFDRMAPLVQERVATLAEVPAMVDFLFLPEPVIDEQSWAKRVEGNEQAAAILDLAIEDYQGCEWTAEALHQATERLAVHFGLSLGKAQFPIRVAVTGRAVGPPLFESLEVLGREATLARLQAARARLGP